MLKIVFSKAIFCYTRYMKFDQLPLSGSFKLERGGREFERIAFGTVDVNHPKYKKALKELPDKTVIAEQVKLERGHYDREEIIRRFGDILMEKIICSVPEAQPYESTHIVDREDPVKNIKQYELARDLRQLLGDLFIDRGIIGEDERDRIRFYTTIGTPLDKDYGIDGFFEFIDKEGKKHRATIDLTTRDPMFHEPHLLTDIYIWKEKIASNKSKKECSEEIFKLLFSLKN